MNYHIKGIKIAAEQLQRINSMRPEQAFARIGELVLPDNEHAQLIASILHEHDKINIEDNDKLAERAWKKIKERAEKESSTIDENLIRQAIKIAESLPWLESIKRSFQQALEEDDHAPLKVAVLGGFSTGKSSLINAWIGDNLLSVGDIPVTANVTVLKYGSVPKAWMFFRDGRHKVLSLQEAREAADQRNKERESKADVELSEMLDHIEIVYPSERLKDIEIIDTPGLNSGLAAHEVVTAEFLERADVVLWVFNASKPGAELEARELEIVNRTAGRIVGLINKIDTIRPRYTDDPEKAQRLQKWEKGLEGAKNDIFKASGHNITTFIPMSALWMKEDHPRSGQSDLRQILLKTAQERDQIRENARKKRIVEISRLSRALISLHQEEKSKQIREQKEQILQGTQYIKKLQEELEEIDKLNRGVRPEMVARLTGADKYYLMVMQRDLLQMTLLLSRLQIHEFYVETWGYLNALALQDMEDIEDIQKHSMNPRVITTIEAYKLLICQMNIPGDEGAEWQSSLKRIKNLGGTLSLDSIFLPAENNSLNQAKYSIIKAFITYAADRYQGTQCHKIDFEPIKNLLKKEISMALQKGIRLHVEKVLTDKYWSHPGKLPIDLAQAIISQKKLLSGELPGNHVLSESLVTYLENNNTNIQVARQPRAFSSAEQKIFQLVAEMAQSKKVEEIVDVLVKAGSRQGYAQRFE